MTQVYNRLDLGMTREVNQLRPKAVKSPMNAINVAINPYQGTTKKVLTVCSAGCLRSPTAAHVLNQEYGYNTRCAGIEASYAIIPVSEALLVWADEIVCMNAEQKSTLKHMIDGLSVDHQAIKDRIQSLGIPDEYEYMNPDLVRLIKEKYEVDYGNSTSES